MLTTTQLKQQIGCSALGQLLFENIHQLIAEYALSIYMTGVLNLPLINSSFSDLSIDTNLFNFDNWINENGLQTIKQAFKDYNMTTIKDLDVNNSNLKSLVSDKRVVSVPQLMGNIIGGIQSLTKQKTKIKENKSVNIRLNGTIDIEKDGIIFRTKQSRIQITHNKRLNLGNGPCTISYALMPFERNLNGGIDKGHGTFYLILNHKLGLRGGKSGTGTIIPSNTQLQLNKYSHIVVTKNENKLCMYINGKLDSTKIDKTKCQNNSNDLFIGNRPNYKNEGIVGKMSFIALWKRCLNNDEIQTIYQDFIYLIDNCCYE
eukprot:191363_1